MKRRLGWVPGTSTCLTIACMLGQGLARMAVAAPAPSAPNDLSAGLPAGIRVQAQGVACPTTAEVEMALRYVLGPGSSTTSEWVLSYGGESTLAGADQTSSLWMDLVSPTGQRFSSRRFPRDDSDCRAIASAMAAVVERSLQSLGWTRGEPLPKGARPEGQDPVPAPLPPRLPRLILGVGPAIGTSAQFGTNLLVEARVRVMNSFSLRLGSTVFAGSDSQAVGQGKASITSRHLCAAILSTFAWGRVSLDTGLDVLLSIDRGATEGFPENAYDYRESLAAGVLVGVGLPISPRWRIVLGVEGLRAVAGANFVVALKNGPTAVVPPPNWQAIISAKVELVAWP